MATERSDVFMASGITINSNLAALNAQRRLGQNTRALEQCFTSLASGLRINRASDDAAGLAVSESLNVDSQVFAQGIRNLNDGISLTNIAEGALQELSNITIRQRELATQAANGTLSLQQRQALNQEANALVSEFNRIAGSTDFNGKSLLDLTLGTLCVQGGYGASGGISFDVGGELSRTAGDGTFGANTSYGTLSGYSIIFADVNEDDLLDMVTAQGMNGGAGVLLGNGNGTFKAQMSFGPSSLATDVAAGDLNSDGFLDLAVTDGTGNTTLVFIGNGNGTFKASSSFGLISSPYSVRLDDLNGDSVLDMLTADTNGDSVSVFIGNGNGTFKARSSFATGSKPFSAELGDVNSDGILDIATGDLVGARVDIFIGNGDGTFKARASFVAPGGVRRPAFGDLNGDGLLDVAVSDTSGGVSVFIGNGDGTLKARSSFASSSGSYSIALNDLNGDGILDMAVADTTAKNISIFIGNGDGTYKSRATFATTDTCQSMAAGDLNGDGAIDLATVDIIVISVGTTSVFLSNTNQVTTTPYLNINTQEGALEAMSVLDQTLMRINSQLGAVGSAQSRLGVAVNTLSVSRENYINARSQIMDADVAQEAAELVKNRILQQAGAAVLAQANTQPQLALRLLGDSPK
jgi:flagellin-like hook-associated protein FlgL